MSATIRVGTCAWVEKGLIADWYPSTATTAEARLRFYAEHYDTDEVDSSYYAIPAERTVYNWGQRTPPGFVFHIKAFGLMTGHRVRPEQLPADLRALVDEVTKGATVVPDGLLPDAPFAAERGLGAVEAMALLLEVRRRAPAAIDRILCATTEGVALTVSGSKLTSHDRVVDLDAPLVWRPLAFHETGGGVGVATSSSLSSHSFVFLGGRRNGRSPSINIFCFRTEEINKLLLNKQ